MTKELNCRDHALPCGRRQCGPRAMVKVYALDGLTYRGNAVGCYRCPMHGEPYPDDQMHDAVVAWNKAVKAGRKGAA